MKGDCNKCFYFPHVHKMGNVKRIKRLMEARHKMLSKIREIEKWISLFTVDQEFEAAYEIDFEKLEDLLEDY